MYVPKGDKAKLSHSELTLLETKILPTARSWITDMPGLAQQAKQTLEYWGEPVPEPRKK